MQNGVSIVPSPSLCSIKGVMHAEQMFSVGIRRLLKWWLFLQTIFIHYLPKLIFHGSVFLGHISLCVAIVKASEFEYVRSYSLGLIVSST